ncbi:MAG: IclR family transcriptional regulator [Synergistaceae bacterium]|nr:IclR family transcriptional regulator [Synergistota bacterium]NLM71313.1 IclR family transcriptional regulator [Synergistaceae bacterium]
MSRIDDRIKQGSVFRVTAIMESLTEEPFSMSVRDIEDRTGIPRSTAHRILSSLEGVGWVNQDQSTGGFRPGLRFLMLSNKSSYYDELVKAAGPVMTSLMNETGCTSVLSVAEGPIGLCVHSVEPPSPMKFTAHRGMSIPLHAGATGKILLAYSSPEVRTEVLSSPLHSPIDGSEVDRAALEEELVRVREAGYAFSREEWMKHAGDISVPVFNGKREFIAQIGVAGFAETVFQAFDDSLRLLKRAALSLENSF